MLPIKNGIRPAKGKAGPDNYPAGPITQGPARTKMRSMTHILILTECRHLQLFSFFMPIIGFLPDNRKKRVRIRINSYDSQWLEDKKQETPKVPCKEAHRSAL
jgi:hypothetical protein